MNDDCTRTFLSLEITRRGLAEVCTLLHSIFICHSGMGWNLSGVMLEFKFQIRKQIQFVNEVYRLHSLPEFYRVSRLLCSLDVLTIVKKSLLSS